LKVAYNNIDVFYAAITSQSENVKNIKCKKKSIQVNQIICYEKLTTLTKLKTLNR